MYMREAAFARACIFGKMPPKSCLWRGTVRDMGATFKMTMSRQAYKQKAATLARHFSINPRRERAILLPLKTA